MLNVNVISMNYENVCGYLCFCCADAVDCGAASPRCMIFTLTPVSGTGTGFGPLSSRERGIRSVVLDLFTLTFDSSPIKGEGELVVGLACCLPSHCPSGLRIKSAMT